MTREDLSVLRIECAADALTHTADQVGQAAYEVSNPTVRHLGQCAAEQVRSISEDVEIDFTSAEDAQSELMVLYLQRIRSLTGTKVAKHIGEGIMMLGVAADLPHEDMRSRWTRAKQTTRMNYIGDDWLMRGTPALEQLAA
jgi:hypothetical protein